jgi:hypothetical protein
MVDLNTNLQDIEQALVDAIKEANPGIVINESSPVYDLLITKIAPVIQEERELTMILTNIARVAPMFDDEGYLLPEYEDFSPYITERFFLSQDTASSVVDTLYLRFNKRDSIFIKAGSTVRLNDLTLPVVPANISKFSSLWIQDGNTYLHPVSVRVNEADSTVFIPATDEWVSGGVNYRASTTTMLIGARSRKALNTVQTPQVTFSGVRNSITNRSLSNMRSVMYNVRNNSVFSPDNLIKAKVMHVNDPVFIERRKVLHEDDDYVLNAVVGGTGKTYLDYGVVLEQADVTLEYLPYDHPLYSELEPVEILNNPREQVRNIVLTGITTENSDNGYIYGLMTWTFNESGSQSTLTFKLYKEFFEYGTTPDESSLVCSGSKVITDYSTGDMFLRFRMLMEEEAYSEISGWCELSIDPDFFNIDEGYEMYTFKKDTFSLYKVDTSSLGLFSPIALGDATLLNSIQSELESQEVGDIVPAFMKASVAIPGAKALVRGDYENQISGVTIASKNTSAASLVRGSLASGELYWRIAEQDGEMVFLLTTDPEFKNSAKLLSSTTLVPGIPAGTPITLDMNDSVYLTITVTLKVDTGYLEESISDYNYLASPGSFIRIANDYVIYRANTSGTAAGDADGKVTKLLYYGTGADTLQTSQEAFLNPSFREAGHLMLAKPYRAIAFTCYYTAEYVSPFVPDKNYDYSEDPNKWYTRLDAAKSKYVNLVTFLEDYFSSYSGELEDINFADLSNSAYTATGMYIRKLDYCVYTQRGYVVRGNINIDMDVDSYITWSDLIEKIEEEVDNVTQVNSVYIPEAERESLITDETIYRPVFVKIPV